MRHGDALHAGAAKLGEQVAARLEAGIAANGWPAGHYLGHEEQLAQAFGVSRTAIREAIAIAEWNGSVESRRGREGGLYVRESMLEPAIAGLRNYLYLTGASLAELLRARRLIEGEILELALERIDREQAARLERIVADRADLSDDRLHLSRLKQTVDSVADLAASPLLRVLGAGLRHCHVDRVRTTTLDDGAYLQASRAVAELRVRQIEAIIAYDRVAARDLQTRAMDVWEAFGQAMPSASLSGAVIVSRLTEVGDDALIYEFVRPAKKAEGVARAIAQLIASRGEEIGSRVGTETDLTAELEVSRRVLREGIRILERFGIVESERGKNGGLLVAQPRPLTLPPTLRGEAAPTGRGDNDAVCTMLLVSAVQAVTREATTIGPAARELAARVHGESIADAQAKAGFIALLQDNLADRVARCLLGVADGLQQRDCAAGPWPLIDRQTLRTVLAAMADGDRFAAPRLIAAGRDQAACRGEGD